MVKSKILSAPIVIVLTDIWDTVKKIWIIGLGKQIAVDINLKIEKYSRKKLFVVMNFKLTFWIYLYNFNLL